MRTSCDSRSVLHFPAEFPLTSSTWGMAKELPLLLLHSWKGEGHHGHPTQLSLGLNRARKRVCGVYSLPSEGKEYNFNSRAEIAE